MWAKGTAFLSSQKHLKDLLQYHKFYFPVFFIFMKGHHMTDSPLQDINKVNYHYEVTLVPNCSELHPLDWDRESNPDLIEYNIGHASYALATNGFEKEMNYDFSYFSSIKTEQTQHLMILPEMIAMTNTIWSKRRHACTPPGKRHFEDIAELYKKGTEVYPAVLGYSEEHELYLVLDGNHRLTALKSIELPQYVIVVKSDKDKAVLQSMLEDEQLETTSRVLNEFIYGEKTFDELIQEAIAAHHRDTFYHGGGSTNLFATELEEFHGIECEQHNNGCTIAIDHLTSFLMNKLALFSRITELNIYGIDWVFYIDYSKLTAFKQLKSLSLFEIDCSNEIVEVLSNLGCCSELVEISLEDCEISNSVIEALADLDSVQQVKATNCTADDSLKGPAFDIWLKSLNQNKKGKRS